MPTSDVDVGQELYKHLVGFAPLAELLTFPCLDEEGEAVNIHRSHAPQQEQLAQHLANCQSADDLCIDDQPFAQPYIWFELRDEVDPGCIGVCNDNRPDSVEFDVEIVSFDLEATLAVAAELRSAIAGLSNGVELTEMGSLKVQGARLLNPSDDYQPFNGLAIDAGAVVRNYSLEIYPYWWE